MRTYLIVLAAVAVLTSCTHSRQIPNFGFISIDPQDVRDIACVGTPAMSASDCQEMIVAAVSMANDALGRPHFRYTGILEPAQAQAEHDRGTIIASGYPRFKGTNTAAAALRELDAQPPHLIQGGLMLISPDVLQDKPSAIPVVTHELLHLTGAEHSVCNGAFRSIMTPGLDCPSFSPAPTGGDAETLRLAYPK